MGIRLGDILRAGALALAGLLAADGCEGMSEDELQRALAEAGGESDGVVAMPVASVSPECEQLAALPSQQGNLAGLLQSARVTEDGSGEFVPPSPDQLTAFQTAFESLLRDGPSAVVVQALSDIGFGVRGFADDPTNTFWLLIEDNTPGRGGGTFVINPAASREAWLEVPHPDSDLGTLEQGAQQVVQLGARALLISGAHRCAAEAAAGCDGTTAKCGGVLRVSDAAHSERSYFMAAHKALRAVSPNGLAVNLHGMESSGVEAAVVSDGTRRDNPNAAANSLRDALNQRLTGERRAFSCNDPADTGYRELCGTTNVQGRFDNGSPDACGAPATSSTGRFIHLEQDSNLRGGDVALVTQALADILPCDAGGQGGLGCTAPTPLCQ